MVEFALLDTRGAARRLKLSRSVLEKWRLQGSGPPYLKIGRAVRYDPRDLDNWLKMLRKESTSDCRQP